MLNRKTVVLIAGILFALVVLIIAVLRHATPQPQKAHSSFATPASVLSSTSAPPQTGAPTRPITAAAAASRISTVVDSLRETNNVDESRRILSELRSFLSSLPAELASAAIRDFLGSHRDAPTKLDFTISKNGVLGDTPSLRVFLLDYLGQVDRAAAAKQAEMILAVPGSPDEWAVSLRNYAWANASPAAQAFIGAKAREMIANTAWRQNPTTGFLEAFDAIVYAGGFDLTPNLAQIVSKPENRAVAHAAYLTLDRLAIENPTTVLNQLQSQPELMTGREVTRANYFARADARDPQQRALLETYLLDPRRTEAELKTFAGIYPNANYMISNNLLTRTQTPDNAAIATRDREALQVVNNWIADPRFAKVRSQLETIKNRLETFVQQAGSTQ